MEVFVNPLRELKEFEDIRELLGSGGGLVQVSGCIDSQKAHMAYCLGEGFSYKIIATSSEAKARELYEEMRFFEKDVLLYPAKDLLFYSSDIRGTLMAKERLAVIRAIIERPQATVVTTLSGFMDNLVELTVLREARLAFRCGETLAVSDLATTLVTRGYQRCGQVEMGGQFAIRGGIIDIFPLTEENPFRIELWDNEIDSIRSFDAESQRSLENLQEILIFPCTEMILDRARLDAGLEKIRREAASYGRSLRDKMLTEEAHRVSESVEELSEELKEWTSLLNLDKYISYFYDHTVSFLDYFPREDTIIFLDEPNRLLEHGRAVEEEFRESMKNRLEKGYVLPGQASLLFGCARIREKINKMTGVTMNTLEISKNEWNIRERFHMEVKSISPYNNSFELLLKDLGYFKRSGYKMLILSGSRIRAKRLAQDIDSSGLPCFYTEDLDRELKFGEIMVSFGKLKKGYEYAVAKFVVITESDIFGKEKPKRKKRTQYEGQKIHSFTDLNLGDYVVHENHGLGIYRGIEKVEVEGIAKDYIKIEYLDSGFLYILATQSDLLQKYAGADAVKPKLNKLGSPEWLKTKTKVRKAVNEIAKDLVELYAARQDREGYRYSPDTVWQREFEDTFPFEETEDQLLAIEATKKDMESGKIMDRLICGDVGYGKTEIAIRAAFKAIQDSKQVVYLVPTTILAQQHYNTFVQRMKDFPVRVDLLCRFRTQKEQKKTIEDLRKGMVDILIGTHRVLSKDVVYKDLGLLIIDEEQRFGVTHKEKIKKLKTNVDVLTLTATPIPRTLHMSLIGIRDMSVLEEPPMDRVPIQTFVMEYNEELVREAINRELGRFGQVYYVFNRVNRIEDVALSIARLVPEARVEFAHGQMPERQLETIMYDFINGEIDVLVATTIIETGLDISNVNTIIIQDADYMGLSQLYQLRGRVGRSNRTAYAYLMYKRDKMLREIAEKRLQAIREFTELGSGIRIAMRDLEIRGAGNLLGERQHGHMQAVGYDLYCKMLNEAVKNFKGEEAGEQYATTIDLSVDAYIPERYIPNEFQKLDIYKRIAGIESEEEGSDMMEELIDRFGTPPRAVQNLLKVADIKALAHSLYVTDILQRENTIRFVLYQRAEVSPEVIQQMVGRHPHALTFKLDTNPYFTYFKKKQEKDVLGLVQSLLEEMRECMEKAQGATGQKAYGTV